MLYPAGAAAALAAIESAVTCSTSTACVIGTNTGSGPGVTGTSKSGTGIPAAGAPIGLSPSGTTGLQVHPHNGLCHLGDLEQQ